MEKKIQWTIVDLDEYAKLNQPTCPISAKIKK